MKEVGLVFFPVFTSPQAYGIILSRPFDANVMTRCHEIKLILYRMAVHLFKLDRRIAPNARVGRESVQVGIYERGNQFTFENVV